MSRFSITMEPQFIFLEGCFCLAEAMMNYELTYGLGDAVVVGNIYENPELIKS